MQDEEEPALPKPGPKPDQITAVIGEVHCIKLRPKQFQIQSIVINQGIHNFFVGREMAAVKDPARVYRFSAR